MRFSLSLLLSIIHCLVSRHKQERSGRGDDLPVIIGDYLQQRHSGDGLLRLLGLKIRGLFHSLRSEARTICSLRKSTFSLAVYARLSPLREGGVKILGFPQ